jgi:hypothetical protein
MFKTIGRSTYRLRFLWIAVGVAVLLTGIFYGVRVFKSLKDGGINDPTANSTLEANLLLKTFPKSQVSIIVLATSSKWTVDQSEFRSTPIIRISFRIMEQDRNRSSPKTSGQLLRSSDSLAIRMRRTCA